MQRIAIIGIGGLFPSADRESVQQQNLDGFWQNIQAARDCSREVPEDRWVLNTETAWADEITVDKVNSVRGCFLQPVSSDATDFDLDANLLAALDPMFHILLQAGKQAWQDVQGNNLDKQRSGVIIGNIVLPTDSVSAIAKDILGPVFESQLLGTPSETRNSTHPLNRYVAGLPAGVLAKALGLSGGSYTLDAACASSLYALKYACDELIAGRTDVMLAGGVSRPDCLYTQMGFSALGAISKSGHCSPFSAQGDGLVVGEGAGIVILKRLTDALRDKDHIYATIAGIGLANDIGGNLMAPDSEGQLRAMREAYRQASWSPADIDLIECHGTGTPIGDAVEYQSLCTLWSECQQPHGSCVLGSVKSNIGHLLTAAGAAGLIKVLLAMQHQQLPPTANFTAPAATIDLQGRPFKILTEAETWHKRRAETPRRAAISAFGFGGINAHVLLEEWQQDEQHSRAVVFPQQQLKAPDIAIIGMEAQFGPWRSLASFKQRIFAERQDSSAAAAKHWWGIDMPQLKGWFIDQLDIPLGRYRIPPAELEEMLPQQLLMLEVAFNAMADAGIGQLSQQQGISTGVFIGIGLDLNTTNFHFRWSLSNRIQTWVEQLSLDLDEHSMDEWQRCLQDAASPALNANRTMGALGGIVASRIARNFNIGGTSFTISSEESSGLRALEKGIRVLQIGELDTAIVGAVDLAGDVRAVLTQHACRSSNATLRPPLVGEGAAALVLKRHQDAQRDGDKIYAVIKGVGAAANGGVDMLVPTEYAYRQAFRQACQEADTDLSKLSLLEIHGSGYQQEDTMEAAALNSLFADVTATQPSVPSSVPCALSSVKSEIGHAGAAAGLASIIKASLCLYHQILPSADKHILTEQLHTQTDDGEQMMLLDHSQHWLRNKIDGPRQASVSAFSVDGNCLNVILEQAQSTAPTAIVRAQPTLFAFSARSDIELLQQIQRFREHAQQNTADLARSWWQQNAYSKQARTAAIVLTDQPLNVSIDKLQRAVEQQQSINDGGSYFSTQALADEGKLAFVYPGAGNHFTGMGRDLAQQWPQVLERLDLENNNLAAQFANGLIWRVATETALNLPQVLLSQIWLSNLTSDVITQFNISPAAVIGYSLGESAGLFATRVWRGRDQMLQRILQSDLFTTALTGPCDSARAHWQVDESKTITWVNGIINRSAAEVRRSIATDPDGYARVYLLIINTLNECVIGGERTQVLKLATDLQADFIVNPHAVTLHCAVANSIKQAYRDLHLFDTKAPADLAFYSNFWQQSYEVTRESAANSIVGQALQTIDYGQVIESAYADGVRLFIEMGPGQFCSRRINNILDDKPHATMPICVKGQDSVANVLHCLGRLIAEHVPLDPSLLYQTDPPVVTIEPTQTITIMVGSAHFALPPLPPVKSDAETHTVPVANNAMQHTWQAVIDEIRLTEATKAKAQETFLRLSANTMQTLVQAFSVEMALLKTTPIIASPSAVKPVLYDRAMCMEIAIGSIGKVLGASFADIDSYPSRVRLPDEPLMLVDRILDIQGTADALITDPKASGSIVTEHDLLPTNWYLDNGHIPTCIAVEAGQADLFLSCYLGIDHITKGLAFYRLLDAKIMFHDTLPKPTQTIRYEIQIDEFFRHNDTYLFHFNFIGTVNGQPLLSMTDGRAGFFTQQQLLDGQGIVQTELDRTPQAGKVASNWQPMVAMQVEYYDRQQIDALRRGDLAQCFGDAFANLPLHKPAGLPGDRMTLVHRILSIDPTAGRFGIGQITGEADLHPEDWFLICHFSDDQVMPGTLMYECCLHTLRIYLLRMGWVGEADQVLYQPIIGQTSQLKCRGQVTATTKKVQYEITLKEIGYQNGNGTPYVLADALMYADGKAIVEINTISLQLNGLTKQKIETYWSTKRALPPAKVVLFDFESIHTFATGKPSEAFGDRYQVFDEQRRIARLPRPPYQFLDRIIMIKDCQQWQLSAGGVIEAEYDIPQDAWYFQSNRQSRMPFSILLEVALQPCGWLAAYLGSALSSDIDLSFRNLGGSGTQLMSVQPTAGILTTRIKITNVSKFGDMIIQNYEMEVRNNNHIVYQGDTDFGFFSDAALSDQVGILGVDLYQPDQASQLRSLCFPYPRQAPYPDQMMRMIDEISMLDPQGGTKGLGFIRGSTKVNAEAWFFKAHFYQDPVWPGSLGLESLLQLMKVFAIHLWGKQDALEHYEFETMVLQQSHQWIYRGQIIPHNKTIVVEATIIEIDHQQKLLRADGLLMVDDRIIYQMNRFTLRIV